MRKLVTPYCEIHKIKPACDKCWNMFFSGSKIVLESAKESAHIIQCQTHLHSYVLVIPLVDFSLPLSWQRFPLSLVPLGPSLLHIFLGRSSSNKAINTVAYLYQKPQRPVLSLGFHPFCFWGCFCSSLWCFSLPILISLLTVSNYSLLRLFKVSFFHTYSMFLYQMTISLSSVK